MALAGRIKKGYELNSLAPNRMEILQEAKRLLNGRIIGSEVLPKDEEWLRSAGLVVIFGASDDLAEIRGAIHDEVGVYDGGEIHFINGGLYERECEDEGCPHELEIQNGTYDVKACWGERGASWSYETSIPHETFNVLEDDEVFCIGIVFCRESISGKNG